MNDFLNFVGSCKDKIKITKDKNLEYDPYFYERQTELQQIRDDIKSGKAEMISDKDFWEDIDIYVSSLQK
ncbi:MAG: hypothetical protein A2525_03915 [Sulfurimonas sp. RIFOXYD12_FULL_36_11]|nr:MAG: hypothetical protein A2525_03915 [Sulfurimonas sp. RIFOXYD12_FULL_36_11]